jgi:hypothetical protein
MNLNSGRKALELRLVTLEFGTKKLLQVLSCVYCKMLQ